MATVKLYRDEVDEGQLPQICMRCGAPADIQKYKRFSWCPGWVIVLFFFGLLPWLIVTLVLTKRMSVCVPLCNQHKNHWLTRSLIVFGGLALVILAAVVTIALFATEENRKDPNSPGLGGIACVGTIGALLLLIVVAAILQNSTIRASEITDRRIALTSVAREFKEALQDWDTINPDTPEDYGKRFKDREKRIKSEEFYDRESRRPRHDHDDVDE